MELNCSKNVDKLILPIRYRDGHPYAFSLCLNRFNSGYKFNLQKSATSGGILIARQLRVSVQIRRRVINSCMRPRVNGENQGLFPNLTETQKVVKKKKILRALLSDAPDP